MNFIKHLPPYLLLFISIDIRVEKLNLVIFSLFNLVLFSFNS